MIKNIFWSPSRRHSLSLGLVGLLLILNLAGFSSLSTAQEPAISPTGAISGPALAVDAAANRHPISPDIYGITFWYGSKATAETSFAKAIWLPVNRSGGDATSRYNWQVDSSNSANDWFYTAGNGQTNPVPSASMDTIIDQNRAVGAKTVMTVPIIQYINAYSAYNCSFPQSVYGNQKSYNPYVFHNNNRNDKCGNGVDTGNNNITDTHISDHDILNDPNIQKNWVNHLVGKYNKATSGGVQIYQLDNEPSGWLAEHRDVHPQGVGYTELRDRSQSYAAALKAADPSAQVLGPGDITYAYYDCNACGNDGAAAHGGTQFGEWYLQQMAAYQQAHNVRLLDYYAMHYPGCCGSDPIVMALSRIQTFQTWINKDYPGTKLAFDEYNWGNADQLSNALLTADGLGLFGREGVDLASYWGLDDVTWPVGYAFRLYRNYDGNGNGFGETSLKATSTDSLKLSVYGAQRNSDSALTLMIINRNGSDLSSNLALSGFSPASSAQVYGYSGTNPTAIVRKSDQAVSASGFSATYPANSVTLVVIPRLSTPANTCTAPATPVTSINDDGSGNICGSLSHALLLAQAGNTINFSLSSGNTITISGNLPPVPPGVIIDGGNCANHSPALILNGAAQVPKPKGLVLGKGAVLKNLRLTNFSMPGIVAQAGNNRLICLKISKILG